MSRLSGSVWMACVGAVALTCAVLACAETVRPTYDADAASDGGTANLPGTDAPYDAEPAPGDATRPELDDVAVVCQTTPCALELERGDEYFCARMSDGTVRCWGGDINPSGTLGAVEPRDAGADAAPWGSVPVRVAGLAAVDQLSVDIDTACARTDGGIACWGENFYGQLAFVNAAGHAVTDYVPHPTPHPIALPANVEKVTVGEGSVCALLASGEPWCWGAGPGSNLLRTPDNRAYYVPGASTVPAGIGKLVAVETLANGGFGIVAGGALASWGSFDSFPLGRISSLQVDGPDFVTAITDEVVSLTSNGGQACAVARNHPPRGNDVTSRLWCWGSNDYGQLGNGVQDHRDVPTLVEILTNDLAGPERVSTFASAQGAPSTCVRMTDSSVYCAGSNNSGRLGRPESTRLSAIFVPIMGVSDAVSVATGGSTSCALLKTGEVDCWGGNDLGQLGIGTRDTIAHPTPSRVAFPP